jgi:hypothetical protein
MYFLKKRLYFLESFITNAYVFTQISILHSHDLEMKARSQTSLQSN